MFLENQQNITNNNGKHSYPFFFGINIRSLRCHFDELMLKIQDYDSNRPSLIFITESWLTENDPLSEYALEGYQQLESKPRKNGTRGGVAFYARYGVDYQIIDYSSELECLIIEATFDEAIIKNFCVVYRPDGVKFTVFLDLFESLLLFLKTLKHDCTLFGDFNIDTLNDDNEKRKYVNLLAAYGYEIQNSSPTRVTTTSSTCIDHVINAFPIEIKTVKVTISDHYALQSENSYSIE